MRGLWRYFAKTQMCEIYSNPWRSKGISKVKVIHHLGTMNIINIWFCNPPLAWKCFMNENSWKTNCKIPCGQTRWSQRITSQTGTTSEDPECLTKFDAHPFNPFQGYSTEKTETCTTQCPHLQTPIVKEARVNPMGTTTTIFTKYYNSEWHNCRDIFSRAESKH